MQCTTPLNSKRLADESTGQYLQRLSLAMIDARNNRTYHQLRNADFFHPCFNARIDNQPGAEEMSFEDHVKAWDSMMVEHPETFIKVLEAYTYVDESYRTASVYLTKELHGYPPGITHNGMTVFAWTKVDGKWLCVRSYGLRGMGSTSEARAVLRSDDL